MVGEEVSMSRGRWAANWRLQKAAVKGLGLGRERSAAVAQYRHSSARRGGEERYGGANGAEEAFRIDCAMPPFLESKAWPPCGKPEPTRMHVSTQAATIGLPRPAASPSRARRDTPNRFVALWPPMHCQWAIRTAIRTAIRCQRRRSFDRSLAPLTIRASALRPLAPRLADLIQFCSRGLKAIIHDIPSSSKLEENSRNLLVLLLIFPIVTCMPGCRLLASNDVL